MSERDYLIAKAERSYREGLVSRAFPGSPNKVEYRRGGTLERTKNTVVGSLKGEVAGIPIGAGAGAAAGAAAKLHPKLRGLPTKHAVGGGALAGGGVGSAVGGAVGRQRGMDKNIRSGEIRITRRKDDKRATGAKWWGPLRFQD